MADLGNEESIVVVWELVVGVSEVLLALPSAGGTMRLEGKVVDAAGGVR